jgi:NADP-reducing hydrogenase subunit HndB
MKPREDVAGATRVVVHMGTCGIAAGARGVMSALLDEVTKRNLSGIVVTQAGCLGICDQEPIVTVTKAGGEAVRYGKMTPEKMREIVQRHLIGNEVAREHVLRIQAD